MRSHPILLMIGLAVGIMSLFGLCDIMSPAAAQSSSLRPGNAPHPTGSMLPDFTFQDGTGRSVSLSDYKGHYVLLNLWATWCGPCAAEMPSLDALSQQFPADKLTIVAIAEDHDGLAAARYFYKKRELKNLGLYADPTGQTISLLHARGLPTTLLLGPDGVEIKRFEGAENWMSAKILNDLKSIIH